MLIGMRVSGTEKYENVEIQSIAVQVTAVEVTGSIQAHPENPVFKSLLGGDSLDLEFAKSADDDSDVVTLSGVAATARHFGSGLGWEDPRESMDFIADAYVVED